MRRFFCALALILLAAGAGDARPSVAAGVYQWSKAEATAMVAVTRVFASRYPLGGSGAGIDLLALGEWTASVGGGVVLRRLDDGCQFQLERDPGAHFLAGIDFSRLSGEYEVDSSGRLYMPGQGAAVCDYSGAVGKITCFSNYRSGPEGEGVRILDLVRAFRYLYSNVCAPVDTPVR